MPRVMLNEVKHLKMSLREILPSLRFVRMTLAELLLKYIPVLLHL